VDNGFVLADYSLHYLSTIAFGEKNWEQARQYAGQIRQQYPQSIWFAPAELQIIKIDLAEKKYKQAIARLRSLRSGKNATSEILQEALFLEAQAQDRVGESNQAFAIYGELRASYPNSRWTPPARREQTRLREKFPELFPLNTPQLLAEEADRLAREAQHSDAENLYKKLLNGNPEGELRLRLLVKLAALYMSIAKRNEAIPVLEQIVRDYPDSPEAPQALYQIAQVLWNRHENAKALDFFKAVIERYPSSSYTDRAQYALGDIYEYSARESWRFNFTVICPNNFPKANCATTPCGVWRGSITAAANGSQRCRPSLPWQARPAITPFAARPSIGRRAQQKN
jgi:outer membrane protein assembly factor BamD (BamD/ComL family)